MPLDECVDTLIFLQALAEMEYSKKITAVGYMQYQGADEELNRLSREVSTHAYRQIEAQYWMAKDRATHYDIREATPNMFVVSGGEASSYHVDTSVRGGIFAAKLTTLANVTVTFDIYAAPEIPLLLCVYAHHATYMSARDVLETAQWKERYSDSAHCASVEAIVQVEPTCRRGRWPRRSSGSKILSSS
jgi:hypothetical protein